DTGERDRRGAVRMALHVAGEALQEALRQDGRTLEQSHQTGLGEDEDFGEAVGADGGGTFAAGKEGNLAEVLAGLEAGEGPLQAELLIDLEDLKSAAFDDEHLLARVPHGDHKFLVLVGPLLGDPGDLLKVFAAEGAKDLDLGEDVENV